VANLPYYITNVVVRHLLEASPPPALTVVMVQEEVAERICAEPGDMSILSVSVQFYAEPSIAFRVPADAFYPRPNVDSAVLRLESRLHPAVASADGITPAVDVKRFFAMVRAGFSQKRKQLRNSLSGGLHLPKKTVDAALRAADIDPSRRAQTLSLFEWARLYQTLEGIG
jgi:16S rRNA (adenine1518-N6/adenine1519-N6)-dimethyltransferase